jgi:hypothetical protein
MCFRIVTAACLLAASLPAFAANIASISRLEAGPGNVLFVADWKEARIHAVTLPPATHTPAGGAFNILDLESLLARQVGGAPITVEDMAVRPGTGEVYVAISYGETKAPALFAVMSDGKARRVDLKAAKETSVALRDAPTTNASFWKETPERSFTVTDMKWRDGELFASGLSNQDFASTLRRIHYPFGDAQAVTSVEIFHGGHNLVETRAPVRAMSFAELDGIPYLVAAYTCTPLVLIPLTDLKDGAHIRGKTVAELGYGNTPADMISYSVTSEGKKSDLLMLVNYNRVSNIIPVSELQAAKNRPGIETQVAFGQLAGVDVMQAPLAGVLRIDNLDDDSFVMIRRDLQKDRLQMVSMGKDLSFRLTDHVSEYAFPDFSFKGNDFQIQKIKPRQDILLKAEGFPDLIKATD